MVSFGEDRAAAERALAKAKAAVSSHGALGLSASPMEMAEFLTLKVRLREAGATMAEAVEFFMKHGTLVRNRVTVPEMVEAFVWAKVEAGKSKRTVETYRGTLRSLARAYPLRLAHELTAAEVQAWLAGQGWSGRTQAGALGYFRSLYAWGAERAQGMVAVDPSAGMVVTAEAGEEIGTLSVGQCERMLKAALREPRMMPYVVLGMFGGLRRAEIERLTWDAVNLEERMVVVNARISKTRTRRVVDLTENAVAWIRAAGPEVRGKGVRVAPSNLKELWPKFWPKCGLAVWPNNGLRHTFASMHFAMWQDEAKLQAQMGHESATMLHRHYRALKTRREAEAFWALTPAGGHAEC
jgi:integrase